MIEKLTKISIPALTILLFFTLVVFVPIQMRTVYLTEKSHINGNFVFYNTNFLYLSDLLLFLMALLWVGGVSLGKFHVKQGSNYQILYLILLCLAIISGVSLIVSRDTFVPIQLFGLIKLFLSIILFCFIINNFSVKRLFHITFWLILAVSLFESSLAIVQYFSQKSVGLKILGEEHLRPFLPGVARFKMLLGHKWVFDEILNVSHESLIMRPYGTFSHPNVLGAFISFSALLSYYLFIVSRETWKKIFIGLAIFIQIFTLTISFSRVAIMSWLIVTIIWFSTMFIMKRRNTSVTLVPSNLAFSGLGILVIFSFAASLALFHPQFLERSGIVSYGTSNQEAISDRILYQSISFQMIKKHPFAGVGFQNFVNRAGEFISVPLKAYQHQPVHNIYLLVAAETGLFGMLLFLSFISFVLRLIKKNEPTPLSATLLSIFVGFLFIGLFDHYLLTIQQGRLMFFLMTGLLVASTLTPLNGGLNGGLIERVKLRTSESSKE